MPLWVEAWRDSRVNVAILAVLLSVLTLIFAFQSVLSRSRRAHRLVRTGFLLVVLVWLGWIAGVQLSIVNVINYVRAPFAGLGIEFYLAEPLMLIIAAYTLLSVVLIGRGVFCGWLCPFGALQELLAQLSRALDVPQWNPSAGARAAPADRQIHRRHSGADAGSNRDRSVGDRHGGRAVQDRDHGKIHARLALCALCRCVCWPSGCSPSGPIAASCVRSAACSPCSIGCTSSTAQAPPRMRQSLPSVRTVVPGAGDREDRQDRHRGVLSVPRLPGRIL